MVSTPPAIESLDPVTRAALAWMSGAAGCGVHRGVDGPDPAGERVDGSLDAGCMLVGRCDVSLGALLVSRHRFEVARGG